MTNSRDPVAAARASSRRAGDESRACEARASERLARMRDARKGAARASWTRASWSARVSWCTRIGVLVHNLEVHSCAMLLGAFLRKEDVGVRRQIDVRSCALEMRAPEPKDTYV